MTNPRSLVESSHEATSSSLKRPRILVFAYGCDPELGSEEGAGWHLVCAIGNFADCVLLVSSDHEQSLKRWQKENGAAWLTIVPVRDLPFSARAKAKWHRILIFLMYLYWMRRAYQVGARLHKAKPFDATYHATYSAYWLPTVATRFDVPCIWGPVGGGVTTPVRLWPYLGLRGLFDEALDLLSVCCASFWPATRRSWRRASVPLVQNEETLKRLPPALRERAVILNHVLFVGGAQPKTRNSKPQCLSIQPLETRKGLRLLIHAMAFTPDKVRLVIAGDGPDRKALERLADKLGLSDRIEFLGRVPRQRVFELLAESAAAVFTGLREEGGVALAEAMLCGTPVVVLANGGARTVAASANDPERAILVQPDGAQETARRLAEAMTRLSEIPREPRGPLLDQDAARDRLGQAIERALETGAVETAGEPVHPRAHL
jgi:glycosyltransferase involved in cell wall biosynthesis